MTQREKILVGIVGGIVALFLNIYLLGFFTRNQRTLRQGLASRESQLQAMRMLYADRDLWQARAQWMDAHQPKLDEKSRATAGVQLMDQVRDVAKRHSVLIAPETLSIGTPETRSYCIAVPVTIETKSSFEALVSFLAELQGPDKFIVLEMANLKKDPADPKQMSGSFKVARWYAPK